MTGRPILALAAVILGLATVPALAQTGGNGPGLAQCQSQARDVERRLSLQKNTLSTRDQLDARRRLGDARGQCMTQPGPASDALKSLNQDLRGRPRQSR